MAFGLPLPPYFSEDNSKANFLTKRRAKSINFYTIQAFPPIRLHLACRHFESFPPNDVQLHFAVGMISKFIFYLLLFFFLFPSFFSVAFIFLFFFRGLCFVIIKKIKLQRLKRLGKFMLFGSWLNKFV